MGGVGFAAGTKCPGQVGQEHNADGDADDAERELIEAVGIIEPRHGAGLERSYDRADNNIDLHDAAGDDARSGERGEPFDTRRPARPPRLELDAGTAAGEEQECELEYAADGHRAGEQDAGARRANLAVDIDED